MYVHCIYFGLCQSRQRWIAHDLVPVSPLQEGMVDKLQKRIRERCQGVSLGFHMIMADVWGTDEFVQSRPYFSGIEFQRCLDEFIEGVLDDQAG